MSQLNEVYMELEMLIRDYSETLITELALRDELEFEKELKNSFISLLLAVQNRRRQYHVEKKRNSRAGNTNKNVTNEPKVCQKFLKLYKVLVCYHPTRFHAGTNLLSVFP